MVFLRFLIFGFALAVGTSGSLAQDNVAIVINNIKYQNMPDATRNIQISSLVSELNRAGFSIRHISNLNRKGLDRLAPGLSSDIAEADRVLVFLRGHVISSERDSWLLTTDAPSTLRFRIGAYGLPIGEMIDLLGEKAGSAVVLVGEIGKPNNIGSGFDYGYRANNVAQGVTVFSGRPDSMANLTRDHLLVPGTTTRAAANAARRDVRSNGFLSPHVAFLPTSSHVPDEAPTDELEQLIWENALANGSVKAMQMYLSRFPDGRFSDAATEMLTKLQRSPVEVARDNELALALDRDQRRDIQRDLSLLGFDPRGIDGVFGRGSRLAVRNWQQTRGLEATGYLTGNQIAVLDALAATRAAELEEEARKRREIQDRQDAEFWRDTGRDGGESGLRAYLKRYPDGLYSEIAVDRLRVFDEERRRTAAIAEKNAWDVALETNTGPGYTAFLKTYPDGAFSELAKEKLAVLAAKQGNSADIQEERRVLGNPITRILVERRLSDLGFKPGNIDGKIDAKTRKAVRRFQRAAGIPVSGFVTQATLVRLMAAQ